MSILLPNENERTSRLDDILYALCTLSLLDEYDVPNEDRINEYYKALLTGDLSELTFMPKLRIEKLLHFLTIGTNEGIEAPKSRIEYLLYVLAGLMQVSALPFNVNERSNRHEKYLMYLIENGGVGVKSLTVSFFNNQEILNSEEGNVENLTFKGNTILPVIKENLLSEEVDTGNVECSDSEYEGEFESASLKGQTLVNVAKYHSVIGTQNVSQVQSSIVFDGVYYEYIKNVDYTTGINFNCLGSDFEIGKKYLVVVDNRSDFPLTLYRRGNYSPIDLSFQNGIHKVVVDIKDDSCKQGISVGNLTTTSSGIVKFSIMIIEYQEGMKNWNIPYFTGMTSVKMPILTTTGKNLFDCYSSDYSPLNVTHRVEDNKVTVTQTVETDSGCSIRYRFHLKAGTTYVYQANYINPEKNSIYLRVSHVDGNTYGQWISDTFKNSEGHLYKKFTPQIDGFYYLHLYNKVYQAPTNVGSEVTWTNIQLEESDIKTPYESYKTNILSIPESVELGGIGDVKDTLDLMTGENVIKTDEIVLDGTRVWRRSSHSDDWTTHSLFMCSTSGFIASSNDIVNVVSNLLKSKSANEQWNGVEEDSISINIDGNLYVAIERNKLTSDDVGSFKVYLSQNNIRVRGVLKEQVINTVDLSIVDHNDNTLEKMSTFKDGHIILSSEEGALIPSLTYSVARNDAFELTNLKSNNTYTVQTNEKEFTLNGVTYPEIETSATTTASVDRVISIDDIYTRVDNVEKMVLEGMNYGNLLQESGQDEFVSHASDENQTITINDTVEGRLKDLTLKGDTLVNILPSESTLRNEMSNSYSQKLNNDYDEVIVVDGEYKDLNVEGRTLLNLASVQNDSEANFYVVGKEVNGQSVEIEQENFDYSVPRNLKDVTLEGSTYISKTASLINSMDNISMQKLNEGYDDVNVVDGEFKSAILNGMTLVNLVPSNYNPYATGLTESWSFSRFLFRPQFVTNYNIPSLQDVKSNTKYFLKFFVEINTITDGNIAINNSDVSSVFPEHIAVPIGFTGWMSTIITSKTLTDAEKVVIRFQNATGKGGDFKLSKIMLIEYQEGMENWDIPYFEGMQSVRMPVLKTTGKNLVDDTNLKQYNLAEVSVIDGIPIEVQPNKTYYAGLTFQDGIEASTNYFTLEYKDKNGVIVTSKYHNSVVSFTEQQAQKIKSVNIYTNKKHGQSRVFVEHLWFSESNEPTPYEPYKSNILTCNEEVTLRGVDDIKDELNLMTGELTQKIGELTIDAYNTNISLHEFYDNTVALKISTDMVSTGEKQIICDSLPTITLEDMSNGSIGVATSTTDGDSYIYVSIPTDGLTTATIQDICAYFTTNPINIKYPLATKVVSEVDLSVTDQDDVTLESPLVYNSGNITLSSDSILPSLDYEVESLNSFSNLKPNTTYTIKKNTQDFSSTYEIGDITYTTSNTLTTTGNSEVVVLTSTISDTDKVALIEGNNIGIDIPYFEGMQSVEQPVLTISNEDGTKSNILTVNEDVTLRSNGDICDELNLLTGQLTQRIDEDGEVLSQEVVKTVGLSIVDQNNVSQSNLQLQTQLSHITTSSDTLIPIFNISATNNYDVQIKPSTQYTVRLSQDVVGDQLSVDLGGTIQTVTSNEFTITTPFTITHEQLRISGAGNVVGEIQLFEGNVTGLVNEYFDGMKVSKISILTTTGKNLIDKYKLKDEHISHNYLWTKNYNEQPSVSIKPNTNYSFSLSDFKGDGKIILWSKGNKSRQANILNALKGVLFTTNSTEDGFSFYASVTNDGNAKTHTVQLEESSSITPYEPYKSNVLSTGEEVVLRSLPNGVCDTLNLVTGEYVQRVGKIVLDGSENWYLNTTKTNTQVFGLTMSDIATTQNNLYCETMMVASGIDAEIIATNGGGLFIGLLKTKASTVDELKAYLSQNPITVQYELATPIITQINPTITDQDENAINAPLAYKNGHIQVTTSEIAPIVNYEIPTSNSYHLDLAVNGGTYTVKGDNTNELITHNSEPLISDDTHLMVIEGDCVSKDVPYFEGMTSVQTPKLIISNCSNINCEEYKYTTVETDVLDGIVLRAIGDVKDELNLVTGELTQRIGEIVLDGSEVGWGTSGFPNQNETIIFQMNTNNNLHIPHPKPGSLPIVAEMRSINDTTVDLEGILTCQGTDGHGFYIRINRNRLETEDVEGFETWLSQNLLTVQYQLETEFITMIDLTKINQDDEELNYISSYDTITHFEASSESLFPTVSISPVSYPVTLKTNTTYTLMFNKVETSNNPLVVNLGGTQIQLTNGEDITTITTPNTLANQNITWYGAGHKVSEIMVLEGNIEKLPYFEGSIPSRISTLTTVHDNGIRENTLTFNEEIILHSNNTTKDTLDLLTGQLIRYFDMNGNLLETPTTETVTYTVYNNGASDDVLALIPDDNIIFDSAICPRLSYEFDVIRERLFSYNTISSKKLYTKDENFAIVYGDHRGEELPQLDEMTSCINPSITFSDGSNSNTHEIEGTFRSVGTKFDVVDVINNTATINFGTFTLDGTENWVFLGSNTNTTGAYVRDYLVDAPTTNNVLSICSIGCGNASDSLSDEEGVYLNGFNRYVYVRINNDKLQSQDVAGIVAYLSENPIEVIYQLANPVTMNINVTSDGAMVSYEDVTYVSLTSDSGVLPHETIVQVAAKTREVVDEVSTLSLRQNETEEQIEEQSDENLISMVATTEIYENLL